MAVKTRIKIEGSYDDAKNLVDDLVRIIETMDHYEKLKESESRFRSYYSDAHSFANSYTNIDTMKEDIRNIINGRIIRYINNPSNDNTYRAEELMEDTDDGELIY